jgi:DNA-binding CsgD family transcriptional regulator
VALAEGMAGNAAEAAEATDELDRLADHWMSVFDGDLIERGRAWAKVAAGEISAAIAILERGAEAAATDGHFVTETRLLHDIARFGNPAAVANRLRELQSVVDGDLVPACAAHAAALVHGSAQELEACVAGFEAIGALLLAAEAARETSAAYRSAGLERSSTAFARKADTLIESLGQVRTPAVAGNSEIERLTRREREIAGLAASGLASQEIAERLFVSIRTVHNHLQHVYTKLGVTSREELTSVLDGG